jgi:hypothetical protein
MALDQAQQTTGIRITCEDEEVRCTGIIQSERQVFDLAQEFFGKDRQGGPA